MSVQVTFLRGQRGSDEVPGRRVALVLSPQPMKPHVVCHMMVSLDGRIHPSRWTASPDGDRKAWTTVYEDVHGTLAGDAWLVGRVKCRPETGGRPRRNRPTRSTPTSRPPRGTAPGSAAARADWGLRTCGPPR